MKEDGALIGLGPPSHAEILDCGKELGVREPRGDAVLAHNGHDLGPGEPIRDAERLDGGKELGVCEPRGDAVGHKRNDLRCSEAKRGHVHLEPINEHAGFKEGVDAIGLAQLDGGLDAISGVHSSDSALVWWFGSGWRGGYLIGHNHVVSSTLVPRDATVPGDPLLLALRLALTTEPGQGMSTLASLHNCIHHDFTIKLFLTYAQYMYNHEAPLLFPSQRKHMMRVLRHDPDNLIH